MANTTNETGGTQPGSDKLETPNKADSPVDPSSAAGHSNTGLCQTPNQYLGDDQKITSNLAAQTEQNKHIDLTAQTSQLEHNSYGLCESPHQYLGDIQKTNSNVAAQTGSTDHNVSTAQTGSTDHNVSTAQVEQVGHSVSTSQVAQIDHNFLNIQNEAAAHNIYFENTEQTGQTDHNVSTTQLGQTDHNVSTTQLGQTDHNVSTTQLGQTDHLEQVGHSISTAQTDHNAFTEHNIHNIATVQTGQTDNSVTTAYNSGADHHTSTTQIGQVDHHVSTEQTSQSDHNVSTDHVDQVGHSISIAQTGDTEHNVFTEHTDQTDHHVATDHTSQTDYELSTTQLGQTDHIDQSGHSISTAQTEHNVFTEQTNHNVATVQTGQTDHSVTTASLDETGHNVSTQMGQNDHTTATTQVGEGEHTTATTQVGEGEHTTATTQVGQGDHTTATTQVGQGDHTTATTQVGQGDHTTVTTQVGQGDHTTATTQVGQGDHTTVTTQVGQGDHTTATTQVGQGDHTTATTQVGQGDHTTATTQVGQGDHTTATTQVGQGDHTTATTQVGQGDHTTATTQVGQGDHTTATTQVGQTNLTSTTTQTDHPASTTPGNIDFNQLEVAGEQFIKVEITKNGHSEIIMVSPTSDLTVQGGETIRIIGAIIHGANNVETEIPIDVLSLLKAPNEGPLMINYTLEGTSEQFLMMIYNFFNGVAAAGPNDVGQVAVGGDTYRPVDFETTPTIAFLGPVSSSIDFEPTIIRPLPVDTNPRDLVGGILFGDNGIPQNNFHLTTLQITQNTPPTTPPPGGGGVSFTINDVTTHEPGVGLLRPANFLVSLSEPSTTPVSVNWHLVPVTATPGSDYVDNSGTVTFAPGQTAQTVSVAIVGDNISEGTEFYHVVLDGPTPGTTITREVGIGTILDDPPTIQINDVTVQEPCAPVDANGNVTGVDTVLATFTATLSNPSTSAVTVHYESVNGTAMAGSDYTPVSGDITFAPGQTSQTIQVTVNSDHLDELTENFQINLSNPTNATIADGQGVGIGTILDAECDVPKLSINDVTIQEPCAPVDANGNVTGVATVLATFTVTLSEPSTQAITVHYTSADGTATAGSDYTGVSGDITFAAGQTSQIVQVAVNSDHLAEGTENFQILLSNPTNAVIADGQGIGTILDAICDTPQISINDVTVQEPCAPVDANGNVTGVATVLATFTVTLSDPSTVPVTVHYASADGTATAGSDYTGVSGDITFAAGQTTQTVQVAVNSDHLDELTENFQINLSNPTNATIADGQGVGIGTILDAECDVPKLSINDITVQEPCAPVDANGNVTGVATVLATFTVTLSEPSTQPITVHYASADGTATAGSDYTGVSGDIIFAAGQTSQTVQVAVNSDHLDELTENFQINLTNPVNAVIADGQGIGTILDAECDVPKLSINDVTIQEPCAPVDANGNVTGVATVLATFTVTLSEPSTQAITVHYASADGTATAGSDYTGVSGDITFAAGQTSQIVQVAVNSDHLAEGTENFQILLSSPTNAVIADGQGIGTILDAICDTPKISINDVTVQEPCAPVDAYGNVTGVATVLATFTVTLSDPSTVPVTVHYASADGTATAGSDYTGVSGDITFAAGQTTQTVQVAVNSDHLDELTENFQINLSNPTNATIADGQGIGTILDAECDVPKLSINDVTVQEPCAPVDANGNVTGVATVLATFTVSLTEPSTQPITVHYASANGTATAGSDYTGVSGDITFNPGQTSQTIQVVVNSDHLAEGTENFQINLSSPTNAVIADGQGVGTILDAECDMTTIKINDVTIQEPCAPVDDCGNVTGVATALAIFTVTLSVPSMVPVTVHYASANGSATAGSDYTGVSGDITFFPGQTTQTIQVPVNSDHLAEGTENFQINLSNPTNATIADGQGIGTILDAVCDTPHVSINNVTVQEPCAPVDAHGNVTGVATALATFTVTLSNPSTVPVTVHYASADGSAHAGSDYTGVSGDITFAAGQTSQTIQVAVNSDHLTEGTENFQILLSNPTNAVIADGQGIGTILDAICDTPPINISINDVTIQEPCAPVDSCGNVTGVATALAIFTVTLNAPSAVPVTVHYASANGTATAGSDYTGVSGDITFAAGQTSQTVQVAVNSDHLAEGTENFQINLSNPTNAVIADGQGVGTILDAVCDTPHVTINDVTIQEPCAPVDANGNVTGVVTALATFTVSLSNPSTVPVTVHYASADGSAHAGSDYTGVSGDITFSPGQTNQIVQVPVNSDHLTEGTENFQILLSNPTNAVIADGQGVGTILDAICDTPHNINISINDVTIQEPCPPVDDCGCSPGMDMGNGMATVLATFTISLNAPSTLPVTVHFASVNGTAMAGSDYTAVSGDVTFNPGQTNQIIQVPVNSDALAEGTENFQIILSNPTNATIADGQGIGTILDAVCDTPKISINDVTVQEPCAPVDDHGNVTGVATSLATFTVTLSNPSTIPVTVHYTSADGTAHAGSDYTGVSGDITFAAGQTTQTVQVAVNSDHLAEGTENFQILLSSPTNATIADGQGVGTILDAVCDVPKLSINDVTIQEPCAPVDANGNVTGVATTLATFTVTLSDPSTVPVTVHYASADGTATAGSDYTGVSGDITFAAGQTTQTVQVAVNSDHLAEGTENFQINLSSPTNATIADGQGVGTILDAVCDVPKLSINDVTIQEPCAPCDANGNVTGVATTLATFTVTLSDPSTVPVTVHYASADGTATAGSDYTGVSGDITFAAGQTTQTVQVAVNSDHLAEGTENFQINLSSPTNATIADGQGVGTILDAVCDVPKLSINDVTIQEPCAPVDANGNVTGVATTLATFTVTLSDPSTVPVTVHYASADGTATAGSDYTGVSGDITFAAGQTTQTVQVAVNSDHLAEGTENFQINLSSPTNATIADGQGVGTILDAVCDVPKLSINDVTIQEPCAPVDANGNVTGVATTLATFTVTLSDPSTVPVTVHYASADGTATAGSDYTGVSGDITFAAGQTTQTVQVAVNSDHLAEGTENFQINLSSPTNATIADGQGVGTILDAVCDVPKLSINDVTIQEPCAPVDANGNVTGVATTLATFTVTLSDPSTVPVTVHYASADGTATAGSDYTGVSGDITFAAGQTTQTVQVAVNSDHLAEGTENFQINLSSPTNATIADGQGVGTILDAVCDVPKLSINDVTIQEPCAPVDANGNVTGVATTLATFTVTLSDPSTVPVTVHYASADGTATAGSDYTGVSGDITFAAGQTTQTVQVAVNSDHLAEGTENFQINLTSPTNATIADGQGVGTILDAVCDVPKISINDVTVQEPCAPCDANGNVTGVATTLATFTVTLSNPSTVPVTVHYASADGSAHAGSDYTGVSGDITFAAGQTTQTVQVAVNSDHLAEGTENFQINLSSPTNATIADGQGVGTILDAVCDVPKISINDVTVQEPCAPCDANGNVTGVATSLATFTVTLSNPSTVPVTVHYASADGSAHAGSDYTGVSGDITFAAGQTTQTVQVAVNSDHLAEGTENFQINLSSPTNATIADGQGVGTILDAVCDTPKISINDVTVQEPCAPVDANGHVTGVATAMATFTVTLTNASTMPVTVHYASANGTATAGSDYTGVSGNITFAPGETTKTIQVAVNSDHLAEGTENFHIDLTSPTNATIADGQGVGTILDAVCDTPKISINDVTVQEPCAPTTCDANGHTGTATTMATFTVSLSNPSTIPVTVHYASANGTATAGSDYTGVSGNITFAPGETTKTIQVAVNSDHLAEGTENFQINLTSPTNATIADGQGVGTILDAVCDTPKISINDVTVQEPCAPVDANGHVTGVATAMATFTVTLTNASTMPVTVHYASANGTATAGSDYTGVSGNITFAPGETTKTIQVAVNSDHLAEGTENFHIDLTSPTNATIADGQGVGTILDAVCDTPKISINDVTVQEPCAPTTCDANGHTGTATTMATFTVSLSNPSTIPVTVHYASANGTATAGSDYTGVSGNITFAPGETTKTIQVAVNSDHLAEGTENFQINLTSPTNATIADGQGVGTILDAVCDTPKISINDVTVQEPCAPVDANGHVTGVATAMATFTVTLTNASTMPVTVHYASANGTATAGSDYTGVSGNITFAPGETTKTIQVAVNSDHLAEGTENFQINLTSPTNATIADGQGVGTILDAVCDTPKISINDVTVQEPCAPTTCDANGHTGTATTMATFTVSLSNPSTIPVTVHYASANGTATAGSDYTGVSGNITFAPGETTKTIQVAVNSDHIAEGTENFQINLTSPTNATIADGQGVGTILDAVCDTPKISINDVTVQEPSTGTTMATFTVTLSNAATSPVTVHYASANGTATAGSDYTGVSGNITFAAGETTKTIQVAVNSDHIVEGTENFKINLSSPTNATISDSQGVGTILDAKCTTDNKDDHGKGDDKSCDTNAVVCATDDKTHTDTKDDQGKGDDKGGKGGDTNVVCATDDKTHTDTKDDQGKGDDKGGKGGDTNVVCATDDKTHTDTKDDQGKGDDKGGKGGDTNVVCATDDKTHTDTKDDQGKGDDKGGKGGDTNVVCATDDKTHTDDHSKDASVVASATIAHPSIDLVYVLDVSATAQANGDLALTKAAMLDVVNNSLMDLVNHGANLNVQIVAMSDAQHTSALGMIDLTASTVGSLIAEINGLHATGTGPSYTAAMQTTQDALNHMPHADYTAVTLVGDGNASGTRNTDPKLVSIPGTNEASEFNNALAVNTATGTLWPFLLSEDIAVRAIGIGTHTNTSVLDNIDHSSSGAIILSDTSNEQGLTHALSNTLTSIHNPWVTDTITAENLDGAHHGVLSDPSADSIKQYLQDTTHNSAKNDSDSAKGDAHGVISSILSHDVNSLVFGAAGSDHGTTNPSSGSHVLYAGTGHTVYGDITHDVIFGNQSGEAKNCDTIHTGNENTFVHAGAGDSIYCGSGDDIVALGSTFPHLVDGGSGTNTLCFGVSGLNIDFAKLMSDPNNHGICQNFDKINLLGLNDGLTSGHVTNNSININPEDVLDMSSKKSVVIDGDSTDAVSGSHWTLANPNVQLNGHSYSHYEGAGGASMMVNNDILHQPVAPVHG